MGVHRWCSGKHCLNGGRLWILFVSEFAMVLGQRVGFFPSNKRKSNLLAVGLQTGR